MTGYEVANDSTALGKCIKDIAGTMLIFIVKVYKCESLKRMYLAIHYPIIL